MSLQQYVIQPEDLTGVGVIGMADTPGLTAAAMQAKLEETARQVVIPRFNAAMTEAADALKTRPTATEVQQLLDEQIVANGVGDMSRVIYDPARLQRDVFAAATDTTAGMVRLGDTADADAGVSAGVAATPAAVQTAVEAAATAQSTAEAAGAAAAAAQQTADTAITDAAAAQTAAVSANANANTKMPIAGGTFTGNVHAATGYDNSWTVRNSFVYYANGSGTGQAVYGIGFYRK